MRPCRAVVSIKNLYTSYCPYVPVHCTSSSAASAKHVNCFVTSTPLHRSVGMHMYTCTILVLYSRLGIFPTSQIRSLANVTSCRHVSQSRRMGSRGRLPQGRFHVLPDPQSAPRALSVHPDKLTCIISFEFRFLVSTTAA